MNKCLRDEMNVGVDREDVVVCDDGVRGSKEVDV